MYCFNITYRQTFKTIFKNEINMIIKERLMSSILAGSAYPQTIPPQNTQEEEFVATVGAPTYLCVGIVDIINSTKVVARLPPNKSSKYYEIFLNNMAKVVRQYNGLVLKTMGDALLFYFPDTRYSERKFGFLSCLECGFSIMAIREKLKILLAEEMLPPIDFRISFDYGNVTMMKSAEGIIDLVGSTINTCSKINGKCPVNGMVIGSDLYEKTKSFKEYKFKNNGNFSIDLKYPYPIFTISRKG